MQTPTRTFKALHEMAVAAAGLRDPSALAGLVVDRARDLLDADAAALYWWFPETGLLQTLAHNDSHNSAPEPPFRSGQGAAGRAFQSAEAIRVGDYQSWDGALASSRQRGVASGMAVPLMVSHRAVGALGVYSNRVRSFEDHEEQLLLLLAAQVAPAMEAARLSDASNQQAHSFRALHEVAIAAGGLRDLAALGNLVVDRARQLLRTESATLRWWDSSQASLRLLAASGPSLTPAVDSIRPGEGTLGEAFERREPVVADGATGSSRQPQTGLAKAGRAALAVPVMARDQPLGSLGVETGEERRFSREEIQLLTLLAAQFGPALEAARLYAESERRRREAEGLAQLVIEGARQSDLAGVLATVVAHGRRLLEADYAGVLLLGTDGRLQVQDSVGVHSDPWRPGHQASVTGHAARVLAQKSTVVLTDIAAGDEYPSHLAEGGQAAVGTPLREAGKPIGALILGWRESRHPSEDQVRLVEAVGGYAATLIDNAKTHERERGLANQAAARTAELAAVIDHIPDAVYVADLTGKMVLVNPAGVALMGVGAGQPTPEPAGVVVLDAQTREPIPPARYAIRQALGGWKVDRHETVVLQPGRPELRLSSSAVPIRDAEGSLTGAVIVFSDVTREAKLVSELAASEAKYRLLFDRNPEAMWVREWGTKRFLAVNDTAVRRYGWSREEFLALSLDDLQPPEELARLDEVRGAEDRYSGPWRHLTRDGTVIEVQTSCHPIEFDGREARLVIASDISDRRRAEALLVESERQLRTIFDEAPVGLARLDLQGNIQAANLALRTMLAATGHEIVGRPFPSLLGAQSGYPEDAVVEFMRSGDEHQAAEVALPDRHGNTRWLRASLSMVRGAGQAPLHLIGMVEDITDRRARTEQLEYLALHDTLTDLPNRTLFDDRLAQAILTSQREQRRLALLVLDLDGFKDVNDIYGHQLGDSLLAQVGPRLATQLRESDTLARLGGDEFAIVLPSADEAGGACQAAERLLLALEAPFDVDGRELKIGGSIGIALAPDHGSDAASVMRSADVAMYAAKRSGTRYAVFSPEHARLSPTRLILMGELEQALERNQLVAHFQPQIAIADERVVGIEVLVRWRHPRHGLMLPEQFLDLADERGLTGQISLWALDQGLAQSRTWFRSAPRQGDIPLAVNMSRLNLEAGELVERVTAALRRWGIDPGMLKLEISERALASGGWRHADQLLALRQLGVGISVDDYGAGNLAATELRQLPITEIKIDCSLIAGLHEDAPQLATVRAAVRLAADLGVPAIAEGVETQVARRVLAELGCTALQGFLITKPMAGRQLSRWLSAGPSLAGNVKADLAQTGAANHEQ